MRFLRDNFETSKLIMGQEAWVLQGSRCSGGSVYHSRQHGSAHSRKHGLGRAWTTHAPHVGQREQGDHLPSFCSRIRISYRLAYRSFASAGLSPR